MPPPQLLGLHREREVPVAVLVDPAVGLQVVALVHVDDDLGAVPEVHARLHGEHQTAVLVTCRSLALAVAPEELRVRKQLQAPRLNERVGLNFVELFERRRKGQSR